MWEEKNLSAGKKKLFFLSVLKKKWMIKEIQSAEMWCCYHNLVTKFSLSVFAKKRMFGLKIVFNPKIAD